MRFSHSHFWLDALNATQRRRLHLHLEVHDVCSTFNPWQEEFLKRPAGTSTACQQRALSVSQLVGGDTPFLRSYSACCSKHDESMAWDGREGGSREALAEDERRENRKKWFNTQKSFGPSSGLGRFFVGIHHQWTSEFLLSFFFWAQFC